MAIVFMMEEDGRIRDRNSHDEPDQKSFSGQPCSGVLRTLRPKYQPHNLASHYNKLQYLLYKCLKIRLHANELYLRERPEHGFSLFDSVSCTDKHYLPNARKHHNRQIHSRTLCPGQRCRRIPRPSTQMGIRKRSKL